MDSNRERTVTIPQPPLSTTRPNLAEMSSFFVFFYAALLFFGTFCATRGFKIGERLLKQRLGSQGLPPCACYSVPCHYTQMAQAKPVLLSGSSHNEKSTTICTAGYTHLASQHWQCARACTSSKGGGGKGDM